MFLRHGDWLIIVIFLMKYLQFAYAQDVFTGIYYFALKENIPDYGIVILIIALNLLTRKMNGFLLPNILPFN